MKDLALNDMAPKFDVVDVSGSPVSNSTSADYTFVLFLRYAGCPWCNLTVHQLVKQYERFADKNCRIVCFIQSDQKVIEDSVIARQKQSIPFSLVADPSMEVYEKYGIKQSKKSIIKAIKDAPQWFRSVFKHGYYQKSVDGSLFLVPGAFVIETSTGKIVYKNYSSSFYSEDSFKPVIAKLV